MVRESLFVSLIFFVSLQAMDREKHCPLFSFYLPQSTSGSKLEFQNYMRDSSIFIGLTQIERRGFVNLKNSFEKIQHQYPNGSWEHDMLKVRSSFIQRSLNKNAMNRTGLNWYKGKYSHLFNGQVINPKLRKSVSSGRVKKLKARKPRKKRT